MGLERIAERWDVATRAAHRLLAAGLPVMWSPDAVQPAFLVDADARAALKNWGVATEPATTSSRAWPLRPLRVAVYATAGAPFHHLGLLGRLGFQVDPVTAGEIRAGLLDSVDILVMPGGGARGMAGQLEPLGEPGARRIGDFVRHGGMYIGSCAGAFLGACVSAAFQEIYPYQAHMRLAEVKLFNDRDAWLGLESPGVGRVLVERLDADHPVLAGLPARFEITHYNGPMFLPQEPLLEGASDRSALVRFIGRTDRFTPSEAFLDPSRHGDLFDAGVRAGAWAAVASSFGRGRVVLFGSHPEFGEDPGMLAEDEPARLLVNALLWRACQPAPSGPPRGFTWESREHADDLLSGLEATRALLRHAGSVAGSLHGTACTTGHPAWLATDRALSIFGLPPADVWTQALGSIVTNAEAARRDLSTVTSLLRESTWDARDPADRRLLRRLAAAVFYQSHPNDGQDGGFEGLLSLSEKARGQLEKARENLGFVPDPPRGFPYEGMDENPYHLVASSYLGAVGLVAGAALSARQWRHVIEDHLAVRSIMGAARFREGELV